MVELRHDLLRSNWCCSMLPERRSQGTLHPHDLERPTAVPPSSLNTLQQTAHLLLLDSAVVMGQTVTHVYHVGIYPVQNTSSSRTSKQEREGRKEGQEVKGMKTRPCEVSPGTSQGERKKSCRNIAGGSA